VGWDLDGRVGSVMIDGRERVGLAWVRDRARRRIVFHALPLTAASNARDTDPPQVEQVEVDESAFRPTFSPSWAKRRRGGRSEAG
jgi:hypothetical protein